MVSSPLRLAYPIRLNAGCGVPAGIASVGATAVGYDSQTPLIDLPGRQHAHFALKGYRENVKALQNSIAKYGTEEKHLGTSIQCWR
jgi:hypothetical protein